MPAGVLLRTVLPLASEAGSGDAHARLRPDRHRQRAFRPARRDPGRQARALRSRGREGPSCRWRLGSHRHDSLEDAARDGAQPLGLARARLLRSRLPRQAGHRGRRPDGAHGQDARPRGRGPRPPVPSQRRADRARPRPLPRPAHDRDRDRQGRDAQDNRGARADRLRHAAVPSVARAFRPGTPCSTATRSSTSRSCRAA